MTTSLAPAAPSSGVHPTRQQLDELDALLQRMLELPVNSVGEDPGIAPPPRKSLDTPRVPAERQPEPPAAAPAPAKTAPPVAEPAPADRENWVPLRSSWQPSAQTWGPLARQWQEAQQTLPKTVESKSPAAPSEEEVEAVAPAPANIAETPEPAERPEKTSSDFRRESDPVATSWRVDAGAASEPLPPLPSLKDLLTPLLPAPPVPVQTEAPPRRSADVPPTPLLLWPFAAITAVFDGCLSVLGPLGRPLRSRSGKSFLGTVGLMSLVIAAALVAIDWFGWTW